MEDEALSCTLPETNSKNSENGWLEDGFPFGMAYLQGFLAFAVSFREGIFSGLKPPLT